jgi:hypothetical protein
VHQDPAGIGRQEAGDVPHQGRLAGTRRANERHYLAFGNFQAHGIKRTTSGKSLGEPLNLNGVSHGTATPRHDSAMTAS